ncbi:hypothetical protein BN1723_014246 [Verticillium longisporum]|uniref:Uncharacterized protein n=1 Tax=Verticillium longisporum TaxID=100787 RepID=A0A0G4M5C5_VERLO|nr:hypothetical protein BN1723_014246 [Verticillium longisporum]
MLDRALKKRSDIQSFLQKNLSEPDPHKRIPEDDFLTFEDWRLLVELREALEPLYRQTIRAQGWAKNGSHGALWEILVVPETLPEYLQLVGEVVNLSKYSTTPPHRLEALSEDSRQYFRLSITNA